jgi:hypothetical protein
VAAREDGAKGAAAATEAVFLLLPFGRPGLRFSGMPVSPEALVTRGATGVEGAVAAFAARTSRVLLLRFPFGRPCFRDMEGAISRALTSSLLPSGTLSPLVAKLLGNDMAELGSERRGSR